MGSEMCIRDSHKDDCFTAEYAPSRDSRATGRVRLGPRCGAVVRTGAVYWLLRCSRSGLPSAAGRTRPVAGRGRAGTAQARRSPPPVPRAPRSGRWGGAYTVTLRPCVDSRVRVTPSFRFEQILPKKHNPIKSSKTRLFKLQESSRVPPGREGVKEMSTNNIGSHPTFICPNRG